MRQMYSDLDDARLDRLIGQALAARAEEVWADAEPTHVFQDRLGARRAGQSGWAIAPRLLRLAVVGLALIGLILGLVLAAGQPRSPDHQLFVVEQLVDAANRRDSTALSVLLRAEGAVLEHPKVRFLGAAPAVYMSDPEIVGGDAAWWLGALDKWGFEGVLEHCTVEVDIVCDVRTRWHVVQVEIGEQWVLRLDGDRISYLGMFRVNLSPPDRTMPLVVDDLDDWAVWVREAHPEEAVHLVPDPGGDLFPQPYFLFALDATPAEIGASIREYLVVGR